MDASRDSTGAASGANDDERGGGGRGLTMRIGGRGASNPYYCHECRKSIPRLTDDNKCPECDGGFVEAARVPADDLIQTLMMLAGAERSQTEQSSNAMNRRQQDESHPATCKAFIERLPVAPKRVKTEMKADDLIESSVEECSICTLEFEKEEAEDSDCTSLPCGHFFHRDCLVPWLEKSDSCPVCRYKLPTDSVKYLREIGEDAEADKIEAERRRQNPPSSIFLEATHDGPRWKCEQCQDYDLCDGCYHSFMDGETTIPEHASRTAQLPEGQEHHSFRLIRSPPRMVAASGGRGEEGGEGGPRIITLDTLLGLIQSGNVVVEHRTDDEDDEDDDDEDMDLSPH
ncbi:hypothetical protein FOZ60_005039 [Perkinsus olseni]|uniref:RING-type E3 ubiquitin transferase n=1 Tax=Perkinsus olseni TaxID=32597 RepID=A0A7J6NU88_PEROL|nr:hypothetical protein FOZ60_005039 [Perkinsus olseni]